MLNDAIANFPLYFLTLVLFLLRSQLTGSSILYPSLRQLIEHLTSNSTLPPCTSATCQETQTQAVFPAAEFTDDDLWKLSAYDPSKANWKATPSHAPYLIASTGFYRGKRIRYYKRHVDQFLGILYAEVPHSLQKPVKKRFNSSLQNATDFSPCCLQSLSMAENLTYGSFAMQQRFSNDCLSLNIYRADLRYGEKRKAIMLFSHGGSNQLGQTNACEDDQLTSAFCSLNLGSGSLFDGSILASEGDIIVVTMNFRLNYHGFLSSGDDRVKGIAELGIH